jgi:hypothetical protein
MTINPVRYRESREPHAKRAKSHEACEDDTKTQPRLRKRRQEQHPACKQVWKALTIEAVETVEAIVLRPKKPVAFDLRI